MVVFVDVNIRQVLIYSETGIRKVPFHDAHILTDIIGNQKVRYVTDVLETNASEVVNLVRSISGQKPVTPPSQRAVAPDLADVVQEATYLHSTAKGTLLIPDMDDRPAEGEKGHVRQALVRFEGHGDCKLFDRDMKAKIQKSALFRGLIKKGTIEIIGEQKKNEMLGVKRAELARTASIHSARDAALNNIIMDGRVDDWDGRVGGEDIAIPLDVGRRGIGGGEDSHGASSMSELSAMIDGTA